MPYNFFPFLQNKASTYLETGQVRDNQLDAFRGVNDEFPLAGETALFRAALALVIALSGSLRRQRLSLGSSLAHSLGHEPDLHRQRQRLGVPHQ